MCTCKDIGIKVIKDLGSCVHVQIGIKVTNYTGTWLTVWIGVSIQGYGLLHGYNYMEKYGKIYNAVNALNVHDTSLSK